MPTAIILRPALLGLSLAAVVFSGCHLNLQISDGFSFTFQGETATRSEQGELLSDTFRAVSVDNRFGDVEIVAANGDYRWSWELKTWAATSEEAESLLQLIRLNVEPSGEMVAFTLELPEEGKQLLKGLKSNLVLHVPSQVAAQLNHRHGNASIRGIAGNVNIEQVHGNLELVDLAGGSQIELSHGDFRGRNLAGVSGSCRHGNTHVEALTGGIEFSSQHGKFEAVSVDGETIVELAHGDFKGESIAGPVKIESRHGDIELSGLTHGGQITTRHGDIEVAISAGAPIFVETNVRHGETRTGFSSQEGGERLLLDAEFGDIRVDQVTPVGDTSSPATGN